MKNHLLGCLLVLPILYTPAWAESKEPVCPPPCKNLSAYIFSDRFCCKKQEHEQIICEAYDWVQAGPNQSPYCDANQRVDVEYFDLADYKPFNPLQEAQKHLKSCKKEEICQVYQCSNDSVAMFIVYVPKSAYISSYLYHADSRSFISVDSHLPYNLNPKEEVIKQVIHSFKGYLCQGFDPKKFLDTHQAPPFSFPDRRGQTQRTATPAENVKAGSEKKNNLPASKSAKSAPVVVSQTKPEDDARSTISKQRREPDAQQSAKEPLAPGAFRLADVVFVPALSPSKDVYRYESTDKQVELKLTFKTGDKSLFHQKLLQTFKDVSIKETSCENGSTLLEFKDEVGYRAFLLHPSAIVSWAGPLYPTAFSDTPAEITKRKELCALNPMRFWK